MKPPKYYHSVKGIGKFTMQEREEYEAGTSFYTNQFENPEEEHFDLLNDEFCVYDPAQVKMRYLAKIDLVY